VMGRVINRLLNRHVYMCFFKLSGYKAHQKQKRGALIKVAGMYVCMHVRMYQYKRMTCIYVRMYVCMYVRTHTDSLSLAHTQTHTGHVIQHDENTVRNVWRRWQVQKQICFYLS
jgi:hypothetical protein